MGATTAIAWTDHTFNPWWGCTKIEGPNGTGSACDHCYAETFAKRTGNAVWGKDAPRRLFGDKHWAEPPKWERHAAAGVQGPNTGRLDHLVFCASMADVFEARDDLDGERMRLWSLSIPAPVRFLSVEPMLGPIDLLNHVEHVNWVICGGESGGGHRPLDLEHARSLRQQCAAWDVPFFFTQVGGRTPTAGGDLLDGVRHKAFPTPSDG